MSIQALSPGTPLDSLEYVIEDTDNIILMTVNPGYKGQPLVPQTMNKIQKLDELLKKMNLRDKVTISVDGNVLEDVQPAKREVVFIRLLETIAPKDAKLVLEMKKRTIKGVSSNVVQKAFPQIQV